LIIDDDYKVTMMAMAVLDRERDTSNPHDGEVWLTWESDFN
jgi:hypothetical protein